MTKTVLRNVTVGEWEKVRNELSVSGSLIDYSIKEVDTRITVTMELDQGNPVAADFIKNNKVVSIHQILSEYLQ